MCLILIVSLMSSCVKKSLENAHAERKLTDEQVEQIGEYHNKYLQLAFKQFNYNADDLSIELASQYERILKNESIPYDIEQQVLNADESIKLLDDNLSNEAMRIINQGVNESYKVEDVASYEQLVNKLEIKAKTTLDKNEVDAALVTLCVLRKSAHFWLPIQKGGSGIGDEILIKLNNSQNHYAKDSGWLAADGTAAGCGMIGGAIGAGLAAGPLGWGFLVGVGISSGLSSGIYALTQSIAAPIVEPIAFDNYEVHSLENAKANIENGELIIRKINESISQFSFKLRPLTDQYWFNVYYNNLLISGNKKITTRFVTKEKSTGVKHLGKEVTFTSDQIHLNTGQDVYKQRLIGINGGGNWRERDTDTIISPQPIIPIVWAIAGAVYVLNKVDYHRDIERNGDGEVNKDTEGWSWNSAGPPIGGNQENGIGMIMNEDNIYQYELYNNLLNDEPIDIPDSNKPQPIAPVVIDGVEYTCTDIPFIKIKTIFNGRLQ